ncbi:MAG: hypothetical protein LBS74_07150 [Oscillospiraceae bacterium]|jgi:hypothetical protein|nr:hypothetical protein [Oscillospiraceae bacterium]
MNNTPFPNISNNVTVEDIHKIRRWNYERRKEMSSDELKSDIRHDANEFRRLMKSVMIPEQKV